MSTCAWHKSHRIPMSTTLLFCFFFINDDIHIDIRVRLIRVLRMANFVNVISFVYTWYVLLWLIWLTNFKPEIGSIFIVQFICLGQIKLFNFQIKLFSSRSAKATTIVIFSLSSRLQVWMETKKKIQSKRRTWIKKYTYINNPVDDCFIHCVSVVICVWS